MANKEKNRTTRIVWGNIGIPSSRDPEAQSVYDNLPLRPGPYVQQRRNLTTIPEEHSKDLLHTLLSLPKWKLLWDFQVVKSHYLVAQSEDTKSNLLMIKKLTKTNLNQKVDYLQNLQHKNLLNNPQCFRFYDEVVLACSFMPLSLVDLAGHQLLDDLSMASILGQVLTGLEYLHKSQLKHGKICIDNVLLDFHGNIQIAGYELCQPSDPVPANGDKEGIIQLIMELANGHYTSGSEIGIYNGGKIPLTVDFLAYIESRTVGVDEMLKQALFSCSWELNSLNNLSAILYYLYFFGNKSYKNAHYPASMELLQ